MPASCRCVSRTSYPPETARVTYDLEYGTDALEIHLDAIEPGQNVLIVDDLLATGGTMEATVRLVRQLGARIVGLAFAIELDFLKGRDRFPRPGRVQPAPLQRVGSKNPAQQVDDERDDGNNDQDMKGKGRNMKDQKAAHPKQQKNNRDR